MYPVCFVNYVTSLYLLPLHPLQRGTIRRGGDDNRARFSIGSFDKC
jgi:hypothetical protein